MKQNELPVGWDEARTQRVLTYYETQTEKEAVAEDAAMFEKRGKTLMEIPAELVPMVRELLAKYRVGSAVPA